MSEFNPDEGRTPSPRSENTPEIEFMDLSFDEWLLDQDSFENFFASEQNKSTQNQPPVDASNLHSLKSDDAIFFVDDSGELASFFTEDSGELARRELTMSLEDFNFEGFNFTDFSLSDNECGLPETATTDDLEELSRKRERSETEDEAADSLIKFNEELTRTRLQAEIAAHPSYEELNRRLENGPEAFLFGTESEFKRANVELVITSKQFEILNNLQSQLNKLI